MTRECFFSSLLVALLVLLSAGYGERLTALTIYRIGGEHLPAPEEEMPHEFVQLSWEAIEENLHGKAELVQVSPDSVSPLRLDPNLNLTPLIEERGGQIENLSFRGWEKHGDEDALIFDRDPNTIYLGDGRFASYSATEKNLLFDFGGRVILHRVRFYPRDQFLSDRFVQKFKIGISDGDSLKDGTREFNVLFRVCPSCPTQSAGDFDLIHDIRENTEAVVDLQLPQMPSRKLVFQAFENTRNVWEIAEFEIYGIGYAPFASYVSNIIDLGAPATLGRISWSGRVDPEARIDLKSRSGDDSEPNAYWRFTERGSERTRLDANGAELTRQAYQKLSFNEKAGTTHDGENWSFWSAPYDFKAMNSSLVSSKPQQFIQFQIDFTSVVQAGARLDYLQFGVSVPPVASQVLAEITPVAVPAGEESNFTYKLRPQIAPNDLGFDSIEIDVPGALKGVDAVRISGTPVEFEIRHLTDNGFAVQIPRIDFERTGELIELDFRAEVFKFSTIFAGRVFDSTRPHEMHQTVAPGDADPLTDTNTLKVDLSQLRQETIWTLRLSPAAFTPNGDGINDAVRIVYDLLNLTSPASVAVELYDLSGRKLATIHRSENLSGRFSFSWDGRNSQGEILPLGIYLLRMEVDADKGRDSAQRVISIAY